ncbi:MAG TPA: hypothetical protein VFB31_10230 [Pseudolabrys sp.]|nr:hypothetical protein [Pseudolabrys sp.]
MRAAPIACVVLALAVLGGMPRHLAQAEGRTVKIKGGETVTFEAASGGRYALTFVAVVSDERCPARVTCVWANPPVIALEAVTQGRPKQAFQLSTSAHRAPQQIEIEGASIRFVDLLPVPQMPREFSKLKPTGAYTAVLAIGGGR